MRRVQSPLDPWSGQVSLPGGKEEVGDTDLIHTARRETKEEVGVDLGTVSRYLGALDDHRAMARGRVVSTSVTPHVFWKTASMELRMGPEASYTFWLPLEPAATGKLDAIYRYKKGSAAASLPSWRYGEEVVWGLTYGILKNLLYYL